jgi:uncharacterized protein YegL
MNEKAKDFAGSSGVDTSEVMVLPLHYLSSSGRKSQKSDNRTLTNGVYMMNANIQRSTSSVMAVAVTLLVFLSGCAEKKFEAIQTPVGPQVSGTPVTPGPTATPAAPTPTPTATPPGMTPTPTPPGSTPTPTATPIATPSPTPPNSTPTPTPTPFDPGCTTDNVEAIYRKTKIIFVVDASGSNVNTTANYGSTSKCGQPGQPCTLPTDPNKSFRNTAISNFLARFRHKENFSWAFNIFGNNESRALVNFAGDQTRPAISYDPSKLDAALTTFRTAVNDYGNTPYEKAIQLAGRAIENDSELNSGSGLTRPNYMVVMLTDGFPTDYFNVQMTPGSTSSDAEFYARFQTAKMNADLEALLNKAPGRVTLSTVYYGQDNDPYATWLLKEMAKSGNGQFASVSDTSNFKIDDVIPGSTNGCK